LEVGEGFGGGGVKTMEVLDKVLKGRRLSKRSQSNYRLVFRSLSAYTEEWPVSVGVAQEWLASLDGFADRTVELWYSIARSAGRYMARVWKVDNAFEQVERPSVRKKKRRYLTADEMVRVIRACKNPGEALLVMVLVDSACRIGELAGLRLEDIGDSGFLVKGKTGERRYRCDGKLCQVMREAPGDGGFIFGGVSGSGLSMKVMRIMRRAGLTGEKLGAHTLRHSSASLVAKETGSVLAVKAILQHDSVDSSMVYIHDVEEEVQKRVSPLKLVSDAAVASGSGVKQLTMGDGVGAPEESQSELNRWDGELPEVGDEVSVRPLLKAEDLRVIREAFRHYIMADSVGRGQVRCRELFVRWLRKVKVGRDGES
jgi:integrase